MNIENIVRSIMASRYIEKLNTVDNKTIEMTSMSCEITCVTSRVSTRNENGTATSKMKTSVQFKAQQVNIRLLEDDTLALPATLSWSFVGAGIVSMWC